MQISKTGVRGYLFKKISKKKTLNNKYKIKKELQVEFLIRG